MTPTAVVKSQFDAADGELVLRVRGGPSDGQVVRLRSTKCTVGSGPDCTLRIRGHAVGSLHCLIFRGKRQTIVRRWGPDTLLNGRTFTDAALAAGDQLRIGTVELEMLDLGQTATHPASDTCASPEPDPFALGKAGLEAQSRSLQACRQKWEAEQLKALRELDARAVEIEALRAELDAGRNALTDERRQWESQRGELSVEQSAHSEQLAARLAELDAQDRSLQKSREQWEAQRAETQGQLDARAAEIEALRTELDAGRNALADERRQWESQRGELSVEQSTCSEQLAARLAELEAQARSLQERREQWEAQRAETQQQLDARAAEIEALRTELDAGRNALADDRRQLESYRGTLSAEQSAHSEQLAARLAELEAQARSLQERREQWEAQRAETQRQLDARAAEMEALRAELDAGRKALADDRRQLESYRGTLSAEQSAHSEQLAARLAELEAQARSLQERREQWEAQRVETQRQLAARAAGIEAFRTELEAGRKALADDRQQWESHCAELSAEQSVHSGQLAARQAELEAQSQSLKERRELWEAQRAEMQRQLDARRAELEARETTCEARETELRARLVEPAEARGQPDRPQAAASQETAGSVSLARKSADAAPSDLEPIQASSEPSETPGAGSAEPPDWPVSGDAPASLADVLRRWGSNADCSQDEEKEVHAAVPRGLEAAAGRQSEDLGGGPDGGRAGEGSEEEESIDAYTARWLARVRGTSDVPAAPAERPNAHRRPAADKPAKPEAESPSTLVPSPAKSELVDLPPRPIASVKPIDLSAMRALAILSASSALGHYARRLTFRTARGKLWVVAVALTAGTVVLWLGGWPAASPIACQLAAASFVVALGWLAQYVSLRRRARAEEAAGSGKYRAAAPPDDTQRSFSGSAEEQLPAER